VTSIRELTAKVASLPVGQTLEVTVVREGEEKTFTAKVAQRRDEVAALARNDAEPKEGLGLQVADPSAETARRFGHDVRDKGVLVMAVEPGSRADRAGVQRGDLIKEINRNPVDSVEDLRAGVNQADDNVGLSLLVKRPNAGFVVIKIS
jgi:serine protease Do